MFDSDLFESLHSLTVVFVVGDECGEGECGMGGVNSLEFLVFSLVEVGLVESGWWGSWVLLELGFNGRTF